MVINLDHLQLRDSVGISPTSLPRGTFDLTAFARGLNAIFVECDLMWSVTDAPKRSLRETITQLIVIAILLALIVGLVIFARQYIDSTTRLRASSLGPPPRQWFVARAKFDSATTTSKRASARATFAR